MKRLTWVILPALILAPHTPGRPTSPRAVVSRLGTYGGPTVDDLTDQLDATRTASRIAQEAADAAEAAEAVRKAQVALRAVSPPPVTAPVVVGPIVVDVARWTAINLCEQGGDWYAYGRFGNGLTGGGGLGMSDGAWTWAVNLAARRGVTLPGFVLDASPLEQMTAAQAIFDVAGGSPWGCRY